MSAKITVTTRLPEEVHRKLKEIADGENRSLSGQILQFIQEGISRLGPHTLPYGRVMTQTEYKEYLKRTGELNE